MARSQRPVGGLLCQRLRRRSSLNTCLGQPLGVPLRTAITSGPATDASTTPGPGKRKTSKTPLLRGGWLLTKGGLIRVRLGRCVSLCPSLPALTSVVGVQQCDS